MKGENAYYRGPPLFFHNRGVRHHDNGKYSLIPLCFWVIKVGLQEIDIHKRKPISLMKKLMYGQSEKKTEMS